MFSFIPFRKKREKLLAPEPKEADIEYILILIKEESSINIVIRETLDIIEKSEGMVESIVGPLIIVLFGVPFFSQNSFKKRDNLINNLKENLGNSMSIVFGSTKCIVGVVGNEKRKAYTAMIPNYREKLNILTSLEYGQQFEI